jgi:aromatic-L-amino-acid decarboxylase
MSSNKAIPRQSSPKRTSLTENHTPTHNKQHVSFASTTNKIEERRPPEKPWRDRPPGPMGTPEWRQRGKDMVEYIAEYMDTIGKRRVTPNIEPGYLKPLLPESAPFKPEKWDQIMEDVEKYIMPGVTHWQHPRFHAYFPAGNAYPSILADMLSDAVGCIGFSWAASPACTELEVIMLDWVGKYSNPLTKQLKCYPFVHLFSISTGKMVGLPSSFACFGENSKGGGVIQVFLPLTISAI